MDGCSAWTISEKAGLADNARFVVFQCADDYYEAADGLARYYESIDLFDAFHPQTILAHTMNDAPLKVAHGAPLRLRVERQLGYKHAKYLLRIEVTDSLSHIGQGKGGFWPDRGYKWYAGISRLPFRVSPCGARTRLSTQRAAGISRAQRSPSQAG
jgi:DMSO/TMAO reductase YedYZ molybdopterin-dependent catalytic subunit